MKISRFTPFIFLFGTVFCANERVTIHSQTNSEPSSPVNTIIDQAVVNSCQAQPCSKENYFLLQVCYFLANRVTKKSNDWATASPNLMLLNPGKMHWRCVKHLNGMLTNSPLYPHMDRWLQFRFSPEDGQKHLLLRAILIGGPLLTKLNIYDTAMNYGDNFFNTILKSVIYHEPTTHAKMVDKLLIVTKPTKWPTLLTSLVPMHTIEKLRHSDEHSVTIGGSSDSTTSNNNNINDNDDSMMNNKQHEQQQQLRVTVTVRVKPPNGYGVIYTVERHGDDAQRHGDAGPSRQSPMPFVKIGLFNDLREQQMQHQTAADGHHHQHHHHFVMFVVEKVGPGLVNHL